MESDMDKKVGKVSSVIADIDSLSGLRDELRLQVHLFQADAKDRWHDAERRWTEIQHELGEIRASADHSREELAAALTLTADALRKSYQDLREAARRL